MSPTYVLGVDPGKTGAIVLLDDDERVHYRAPMPLLEASREYDAAALAVELRGLQRYRPTLYLERPGLVRLAGGNYSAEAQDSLAECVGLVRGLAAALALTVALVAPTTWQAAMGIVSVRASGGRSTTTQAAQRSAAIWPTSTVWLEGERDAALIALYGLGESRIRAASASQRHDRHVCHEVCHEAKDSESQVNTVSLDTSDTCSRGGGCAHA